MREIEGEAKNVIQGDVLDNPNRSSSVKTG
jgi:hypothetical protein